MFVAGAALPTAAVGGWVGAEPEAAPRGMRRPAVSCCERLTGEDTKGGFTTPSPTAERSHAHCGAGSAQWHSECTVALATCEVRCDCGGGNAGDGPQVRGMPAQQPPRRRAHGAGHPPTCCRPLRCALCRSCSSATRCHARGGITAGHDSWRPPLAPVTVRSLRCGGVPVPPSSQLQQRCMLQSATQHSVDRGPHTGAPLTAYLPLTAHTTLSPTAITRAALLSEGAERSLVLGRHRRAGDSVEA